MLFSGYTEINSVRNTYKLAVDQSAKADELVKITSNHGNNAVLMAYYGTGKALQAKHGWNPASRFSLAREAANILNKAVAASPQNLEVRFLRFSFESRAPGMLGLTLHTADDKAWIMSHLDKKHPIWDVMKAFLKDCDLLSAAEKRGL
ncbi:MAG: hypothetical protein EBV15_02675 [Bacteroidetes bacterium]|nr:hypothetical protein [Bacteroidota bacterium]